MACPTPRELEERLGPEGLTDLTARAALLGHLRRCRKCKELAAVLLELEVEESPREARALDRLRKPARTLLHSASQLAGPGSLLHIVPSPEERARLLRRRLRHAPPRWRLPAAVVSGLGLAAAVALVALRPGDPAAALLPLQGESRALEPVISGLPWAAYQPARGARDESAFDPPLRKLLEAREKHKPGAERALAMLFLLRGGGGDAARTDRALLDAGEGADADNDRGVALFARGDHAAALEQFDRALAADSRHRAARFNRALALVRLGLHAQAAEAFEALADHSPWGSEAASRAQRQRTRSPAPLSPGARLDALHALFAASRLSEVEAVQAQLAALPQGVVTDLVALARWAAALSPAQLARHFEQWKQYLLHREDAMAGQLDPAEAERFAAATEGDRILWAPALQLAAFVRQSRGEWRAAQGLQARLLQGCRERGCAVENQAIALDELADAAGRDGDFATAHRLQDRAQALFSGVGAGLQLAELHRKQAALLAEEGRDADAAAAAELALATLDAPDSPDAVHVQGLALAEAAHVAAHRGQPRAALELGEAALELLRTGASREEEAEVAAQLAADEVTLGRAGEARVQLEAEVARMEGLGHLNGVAELRATLADLLVKLGDAQGAADQAGRGLAVAADGWSSARARLSLLHARALRALGREPEAVGELSAALDRAAAAARDHVSQADNPDLRPEALAAELAGIYQQQGRRAEELLLPLDKLRAAALGAVAAQPGWSDALPKGSCVLGVLAGARGAAVALIWPGGGEARVVEQGQPALLPAGIEQQLLPAGIEQQLLPAGIEQQQLPAGIEQQQLLKGVEQRCSPSGELWIFSSAPLDLASVPIQGVPLSRWISLGTASSLTRMLAAEERPASALLVRDAQTEGDGAGAAPALPASRGERESMAQLAPEVFELAGRAATPDAVLSRAASEPLLHFAVHGFDGPEGGSLQLAGAAGRLGAREISAQRLRPGARVVLSSCEAAATPGPRGVMFAFARAGATAIVAARDRVDDAAAARWAQAFYASLARGRDFAQANHDAALLDPRGAAFVVMK